MDGPSGHYVLNFIWFWFLTEETLLSRRAPIKEALPSANFLPILNLTHLINQLTTINCRNMLSGTGRVGDPQLPPGVMDFWSSMATKPFAMRKILTRIPPF